MMNIARYCLFLILASFSLSAPAVTASANGASIPVLSSIIDAEGETWTLSSGVVSRNGAEVANNYNITSLLQYNGIFYVENTTDHWYLWTGSSWVFTQDPRVTSAGGAAIQPGTDVIVDSEKNVWTLSSDEHAYLDGYVAGGNHSVVLVLYLHNLIYCENSSSEWFLWTGSAWQHLSGDPRGPNLVQFASYSSPICPSSDPGCVPPFIGNLSLNFSRATTQGDAIWVAATVSDYGGAHTISVTDSQNNVYHLLNQENDGHPGEQTVVQFYAANIRGGADTITVNWTSDNYKAAVAGEVSGITGVPLVGNNAAIQDGKIAFGTNNVTSNSIEVTTAQVPSLLLALTMDTNGGTSDGGGSGFCAVPAGVGFTQIAQLWNWSPGGQPVCNLATFESLTILEPATTAGSFTTTHLSDPYLTVATIFH